MANNVTPIPGNQTKTNFEADIAQVDGLIVLNYQNMIMAFSPEAAIKAGEALMDAGIELLKTTPEKENE